MKQLLLLLSRYKLQLEGDRRILREFGAADKNEWTFLRNYFFITKKIMVFLFYGKNKKEHIRKKRKKNKSFYNPLFIIVFVLFSLFIGYRFFIGGEKIIKSEGKPFDKII